MLSFRTNKLRIKYVPKVLKFGFSTKNNEEEKVVVYFGLFQRLFSLINIYKPEGSKLFEKLQAEAGDFQFKDLLVLKVFTDLHHPLLLKYKFDRDSFLVGAKEAGDVYFKSLLSPDFKSYLDKMQLNEKETLAVPDCVSLVESTSSPNCFNVVKGIFEALRSQSLPTTLTGININRSFLIDVRPDVFYDTRIRRENIFQFVQKNVFIRRWVNMLIYPNRDDSELVKITQQVVEIDNSITDGDAIRRKLNQFDQIQYTNGSVLANVSVIYNAEVSYKAQSNAPESEESVANVVTAEDGSETVSEVVSGEETSATKDIKDEIKTRNLWLKIVFSGCISSEEEMDWKIIQFGPVYGTRAEHEQNAEV